MTVLKTLKDIEQMPEARCKKGGGMIFDQDCALIPPDILRVEAIKWYKHFEGQLITKEGDEILVNRFGLSMVMHFIKDFFGLSEEDLK